MYHRQLTLDLGADQRRPFPKEVEAAILKRIRTKEVWSGFVGIGRYGFRGQGYHEKVEALKAQELIKKEPEASAATNAKGSSPSAAISKETSRSSTLISVPTTFDPDELPTSFPPTPLISEALDQINLFDANFTGKPRKRSSESVDADIDTAVIKFSNHRTR